MSTETAEQTGRTKAEGSAGQREWTCPLNNKHLHGEELRKVWKECQEESFWYRALPLSVGSMAVTGGLIYNGVWKQSKRFGPFPKLALAGILGYAVGKASYLGTCREKFQKLGPEFDKQLSQGWGPGFGAHRHRSVRNYKNKRWKKRLQLLHKAEESGENDVWAFIKKN